MAFDDPKYLPLETKEGIIEVRRPSVWNQGMIKGCIKGGLIAAALATVAVVAPVGLIGAGLLKLAGIGLFVSHTYNGSMQGAADMQARYDMAKCQHGLIKQAAMPPSVEEKRPGEAKDKYSDMRYHQNHAATLQRSRTGKDISPESTQRR